MSKIDNFKVEAKIRYNEFKFKAKVWWGKTKTWVADNKEMIFVAVPIGVAAIAEGRKVITKIESSINKKKEEDHRDYDVWDPSAGIHIHCKKKMTNADRIEFSYRHSNGEKTVDILRDMGLI